MTFNLAGIMALATTTPQQENSALRLADFRKQIDDAAFWAFLKSEYAEGMTSLDLSDSAITSTALSHLVSSPNAKGLHTLRLARTRAAAAIGDLTEHPALSELRTLDLSGAEVPDSTVRMLFSRHASFSLQVLDLSRTKITDQATEAIASFPSAASLESVSLAENAISNDGLRELLSARLMGLSFLDLSGTRVSSNGFRWMSHPLRPRLKQLLLANTAVSDDILNWLTPETAPELERLDVRGSEMTPGLLRLIEAQLPKLREIVADDPIQVIETILGLAESGKLASPIKMEMVNGINLEPVLSGPLRSPGRKGGGRE
jgi:Leucine-rich repeat (LRR) protein